MKKAPPGEPGHWFHYVVVTIKDGKMTLGKYPIVYEDGKRLESASEGGFYRFEGCLQVEGDHFHAELQLTEVDYAFAPKGGPVLVTIKPSGRHLLVNGKRHRRVAKPDLEGVRF